MTGAAGSIGSEVCRQVAACGPASLVLADIDENGLYLLYRSLRRTHPGLPVVVEVVDIRDAARLRAARRRAPARSASCTRPPTSTCRSWSATPRRRSRTTCSAAATSCAWPRRAAERFVFISTDKAVEPASVMGATKQLAELLVRHREPRSATRFTVGALRQRARQRGQRGAAVQAADRPRRPGDGHPSRLLALPDDDPRGGRPRADRRPRRRGRPVRAGDGRADPRPGAGAPDDHARRPGAGARRADHLHRPAAGGEAARAADDRGRGQERRSFCEGIRGSRDRRPRTTSTLACRLSPPPRRGDRRRVLPLLSETVFGYDPPRPRLV